MHSHAKSLFVVLAALLLAGANARRLMQSSACPVDSTTVTLNFTEVKQACVPTNTTKGPAPREFCDACTCALFSSFAPALQASGISPSNASSMARGVDVVSACVNSFLGQFVSAQVDVQALIELSTCEYNTNEVPACLSGRVAALASNMTMTASNSSANAANTTTAFRSSTNTTAPAGTPPVEASSGLQDYAPDTDAPTEVIDAINNSGSPVTSPTTTPETDPTTTMSPAITPAINTTPDVITVQQPIVIPIASPDAASPVPVPVASPVASPVDAPKASPEPTPNESAASLSSVSVAHAAGLALAVSMLLALVA